MYVIGLDLGTSGVKSTVFNDKAEIICHSIKEYDLLLGEAGQFELDPNILLKRAKEALSESISNIEKSEVKAICVTSFGESFVCMNDKGEVLCNTMIYMDTRGAEESKEITDAIGLENIYAACGTDADLMFAACKLRWMSKHRKKVISEVTKISFIADFILLDLGGEHACDYSLASRSAMFDQKSKCWWKPALAMTGIDETILPKIVPSGTAVGFLNNEAAKLFGLSTDVKLIIGGQDQLMAAVGGGLKTPGDTSNGMGTVDCMTTLFHADELDMEAMREYNFQISPFPGKDLYVAYSFNISGGCILKWFRDTFCKDIMKLPEAYQLLDEETADDSGNVFVIPYLAGGGTPYYDKTTPATIVGMRMNTTRGQIFRAFLEGESYEMRRNIEYLEKAGIFISRIITVGGGAKSKIWMQIRADIFQKPLVLPQNKEAGTLASAIMCLTTLGVYDSIISAQKKLISYEKTYEPNEEKTESYNQKYTKFNEIYNAVKKLY